VPAPESHPFSLDHGELGAFLAGLDAVPTRSGTLRLRLPFDATAGQPEPSPQLAHWIGHIAHEDARSFTLRPLNVHAIAVPPSHAEYLLDALEESASRTDHHLVDEESGHEPADREHVLIGDSIRFFAAAARFARALLAEQRFVPALEQDAAGGVVAQWRPWLSDEGASHRLDLLVRSIPPIARAAVDASEHDPWMIVEGFLAALVDASCRDALIRESMAEAVEDKPRDADPHVAWLSGLLAMPEGPVAVPPRSNALARTVASWIATLDDRGQGGQWRLCLTMHEPDLIADLPDFAPPPEGLLWTVTLGLQSADSEKTIIDAQDIWAWRSTTATIDGRRLDSPHDLLLAELGRASRLYKPLEAALSEPNPTAFTVTTTEAYQFLREIKPILVEQGVGVIAPEWWDTPSSRIGSRLQLFSSSSEQPGDLAPGAPGSVSPARLGLSTLVGYQWQLSVGEVPLTLEEFEKLAAQRTPLVRVDGRWIEIRPEDVRHAIRFIHENPGGQIAVGAALRMAYGTDRAQTGLPIVGIDAKGWIADLLGDATTHSGERMPIVTPPAGFHGELRPYQLKGLSWLVFLDQLGFGPCLADDMGLGKTIQLLALLLHEREQAAAQGADPATAVGPTLLIVPMSIVGNWSREADRFAPTLRLLVHHGMSRLADDSFFEAAARSDLVITTYALAHRDRATLERVGWHRVVLDEAQNIKNPSAKQSRAIHDLAATRRVALTGTPLENRLSELWSIMDFCNPGLLGTAGDFRRAFSVPIERFRDAQQARALRSFVRPFILRRLKTDPAVISDLPEKLETKEYCRLTTEQASLYESCVKGMLAEVERAEGIRRRGIVLTSLIRLKQICNHPTQLLGDDDAQAAATDPALETGPLPQAARSGKCIRLLEMLEEVLAAGDQALIFTQFRRMGAILAPMLRHAFGRDILFLHGGTTTTQRQAMIDRFQKADGTAPIFILSLKAGGVGLNLTAASHVFHFDRWWNPAVENQATDRAFRIGQTKTVNVHKFVVSGTLEEKIDQMIESKIALAEDVIGSGEDWLTELNTDQLRELLTLRPEAIGEE